MVTLSGLNLELQCWWHQGSLSLGLWVCRQLDLEWSSVQLWQNLVVDHFTSWRKTVLFLFFIRPSHHGASSLSGVQKVFFSYLSLNEDVLREFPNARTFLVLYLTLWFICSKQSGGRWRPTALVWLVFGSWCWSPEGRLNPHKSLNALNVCLSLFYMNFWQQESTRSF